MAKFWTFKEYWQHVENMEIRSRVAVSHFNDDLRLYVEHRGDSNVPNLDELIPAVAKRMVAQELMNHMVCDTDLNRARDYAMTHLRRAVRGLAEQPITGTRVLVTQQVIQAWTEVLDDLGEREYPPG